MRGTRPFPLEKDSSLKEVPSPGMPLDEKTLERLVQEQRLAGPKKPAVEIKEATELFEEYVRPVQPGEAPKSKGLRAQGYQFPPPGGPAPPPAPVPSGIPTGEAAEILRDFEPPVPQVQTPKRFTILPPMPAQAPAPAFTAAVLAPQETATVLAPPEHVPEPTPTAGPGS